MNLISCALLVILCIIVNFDSIYQRKRKLEFPYLELLGMSLDEAKAKRLVTCCNTIDEPVKTSNVITKDNVIIGIKFFYKEYYDYNKYYSLLENYAKRKRIRIVEITEDNYFIYKVANFSPPIEECGLFKKNEADRKKIENVCNELLQRDLQQVVFFEQVKNYKKRK